MTGTRRAANAPATALTPRPSNTAKPSVTSGTARPVLRNASPKLDDSANPLNSRQRIVGSPYGLAPTETATPINVTNTKNARCFQRTRAAPRSARIGRP
jgi:hypothetical protein